jgi:hypothetical protein
MKSALQLQLDNNYEILRVAYIRKAETASTVLPIQKKLSQPLTKVISSQAQDSANWDVAWFSHYE